MPYAKFRVLLDKIHQEGKIGHRTNGKFKLYWPQQNQFETLSKEAMDALDVEIVEKRELERELNKGLKTATFTISNLRNQQTLDELKTNLKKVKEEHEMKTKKLNEIKSNSAEIDPEEREKLTKEVKRLKKMWRERKNNCLDVFDQIIDSSSKKEKQVYEEYGLETAEEANQPTLKEFGITIKELI